MGGIPRSQEKEVGNGCAMWAHFGIENLGWRIPQASRDIWVCAWLIPRRGADGKKGISWNLKYRFLGRFQFPIKQQWKAFGDDGIAHFMRIVKTPQPLLEPVIEMGNTSQEWEQPHFFGIFQLPPQIWVDTLDFHYIWGRGEMEKLRISQIIYFYMDLSLQKEQSRACRNSKIPLHCYILDCGCVLGDKNTLRKKCLSWKKHHVF